MYDYSFGIYLEDRRGEDSAVGRLLDDFLRYNPLEEVTIEQLLNNELLMNHSAARHALFEAITLFIQEVADDFELAEEDEDEDEDSRDFEFDDDDDEA